MPLQLEYKTYICKRRLHRQLVDYTHPAFTLAIALIMPRRIKILQSSWLQRDLGQKAGNNFQKGVEAWVSQGQQGLPQA